MAQTPWGVRVLRVEIVHDHLAQRGGAERVVLSIAGALPGAPLHTLVYRPEATYPEYRHLDVRPSVLDRVPALHRNHRLALPLAPTVFGRLRTAADVLLCSSSGWAHGAPAAGAKVVYCHSPNRWIHSPHRYLAQGRSPARLVLSLGSGSLQRWDRAAMAGVTTLLANSHRTRDEIRRLYDRDSEVLFPPCTLTRTGAQRPVPGLESGYLLVVSRLLAYKNVDAVVHAVARTPDDRLVVVGVGPDATRLQALAGSNVRFLGSVDDASLRWLYTHARLLVAPAYEDFGLTPIEAELFGRPTVALRSGGYLDTVLDGRTGVFFDAPQAEHIRTAVAEADGHSWDTRAIEAHAAAFGEQRFAERLREVLSVAGGDSHPPLAARPGTPVEA